jgi:hypothetical protein
MICLMVEVYDIPSPQELGGQDWPSLVLLVRTIRTEIPKPANYTESDDEDRVEQLPAQSRK